MAWQHFDVVWGYTLDYMHCVLQGVTRQITEFMFDSSNSSRSFYIGKLGYVTLKYITVFPGATVILC